MTAAVLCPAAAVTLVEVSPRAAGFARFNLALNGVGADRATVRTGDLFSALEPQPPMRFSLITANVPFVPNPAGCADCAAGALFGDGGQRGDAVLRRVVRGAADALRPGGECWAVGTVARAEPSERTVESWWPSGRHGENRTWRARVGLSRWRLAEEYAGLYEQDAASVARYAAELRAAGVAEIAMDAVLLLRDCNGGGGGGGDCAAAETGESRGALHVKYDELEELWLGSDGDSDMSGSDRSDRSNSGLWEVLAAGPQHAALIEEAMAGWPCDAMLLAS